MTQSRRIPVRIGDRTIAMTNLERVMYPESGTTKAEVLQYLMAVAPRLHERIADRILTRRRWPHGVAGQSFFEKNAPVGTPDWVTTHDHGRDRITYPVIRHDDDPAPACAWFAQLGVLEFHVPQWRIDSDGHRLGVDRLVLDLDPGPPAGLIECRQVALWIREAIGPLGLHPHPVLSGSKGMQLYVDLHRDGPIPAGTTDRTTSEFARTLARSLHAAHPDAVEWRMTKSLRRGKVFIDWSQNNAAKTTIAPYSLRGTALPHVAAPVSWDEVEAGDLHQLSPQEVLDRLPGTPDTM